MNTGMSTGTAMISFVLYIALIVCVVGVLRKVWQYASTPAPLKIPTTPAPVNRRGVVARLLREVVFFESLFKASKWTWVFGWIFHAGLLLALLAHLRYFVNPVWWWVALLAPFSRYAGIAMVIGLTGLLARRIFVDRVRYISAPSDYLMLLLLLVIAGSGLAMRFIWHTDIVAVKAFALSLLALDPKSVPADFMLFLHLSLVAVLLLIFPISKLLHAPGLFFSPSRNQVDNPRERRHVVGWAKDMER